MYTMTEKRNIKLKFLRDVEFIMSDSTQEFDWCKITIKKDTIIKPDYYSYYEYLPGCRYDRAYTIEFVPNEYDGVMIEILRESDDDINDVNELRKEPVILEINADDVETIKAVLMEVK